MFAHVIGVLVYLKDEDALLYLYNFLQLNKRGWIKSLQDLCPLCIKIMYETTREANLYGTWAFLLERPESCKLTVNKTTKKYLQSGSLVISCKEGEQTKLSVEGPPSTTQPLTLGVLG
jgi:hypothetical protein